MNSLFVVVGVLGKIFLHCMKKNIPHSDQCLLYNESITNANTNTNINKITNTNTINPFFCSCYGFSIVAFVNAFIDVLTTIIADDLNYDKCDDDNDAIGELNRQKAEAIATIIDVINVIKQKDFKTVANRYVDLVPALIEIVDDRLGWMEDVQRGKIQTKPIAMKILCDLLFILVVNHLLIITIVTEICVI